MYVALLVCVCNIHLIEWWVNSHIHDNRCKVQHIYEILSFMAGIILRVWLLRRMTVDVSSQYKKIYEPWNDIIVHAIKQITAIHTWYKVFFFLKRQMFYYEAISRIILQFNSFIKALIHFIERSILAKNICKNRDMIINSCAAKNL